MSRNHTPPLTLTRGRDPVLGVVELLRAINLDFAWGHPGKMSGELSDPSRVSLQRVGKELAMFAYPTEACV
jgi:hypothetical protein